MAEAEKIPEKTALNNSELSKRYSAGCRVVTMTHTERMGG
jgi:hypothetical protein